MTKTKTKILFQRFNVCNIFKYGIVTKTKTQTRKMIKKRMKPW